MVLNLEIIIENWIDSMPMIFENALLDFLVSLNCLDSQWNYDFFKMVIIIKLQAKQY